MRIFARIFLSFWLATVLAIVVSIGFVTHHGADMTAEVSRSIPAAELVACADEAAGRERASTAHQPECEVERSIDSSGRDLRSRPVPESFQRLAKVARETGEMQVAPLPGSTVIAVPSTVNSQASPVAIFVRPSGRRRPVSALVMQALPFAAAAALICYFLTGYIVTPLKRLGAVAEQLGGGELASRTDGRLHARRDEFGDLARTFDRMAARIESLVTSQRMFLAHVSHELGSPITRLHMTLVLARRKANPELTPELDRIERETTQLNALVQQLLLLARLESGNELSSETTRFDIAEVLLELAEDAEFEARQLNRFVSIARENGFAVRGSRELIKRALDNVIRNALRFTPDGGTVDIELVHTPGDALGCVLIRDQGPGVSADRMEKIFEPFAHSGSSGGHSGTGLGLAIARHAVWAHQGKISARNLDQGGLLVVIELPLAGD